MHFFSLFMLAATASSISAAPIPFQGIASPPATDLICGLRLNDASKTREAFIDAAFEIANEMIQKMTEIEKDAREFDKGTKSTDPAVQDRLQKAKEAVLLAFGERTWAKDKTLGKSILMDTLERLRNENIPLASTDPDTSLHLKLRIRWLAKQGKEKLCYPSNTVVTWPSLDQLKSAHGDASDSKTAAVTWDRRYIFLGEAFYTMPGAVVDARAAALTLIHEMIHVIRKTSDALVIVQNSGNSPKDVRNASYKEKIDPSLVDSTLSQGYCNGYNAQTKLFHDFRSEADFTTPNCRKLKERSDTLWDNPDSWLIFASKAWNLIPNGQRQGIQNPISRDKNASGIPPRPASTSPQNQPNATGSRSGLPAPRRQSVS